MEQLSNLDNTTLAAGYTAGSGSITVVSATGFPTSGTFSVTIFNAATNNPYLIFRVTSVAGAVFTGAAEGPDANAPLGAAVAGTILTNAAMAQIQQDWLSVGTTAGLPGTTGRNQGQRYKANDAPYEYIFNGSIWVPYYKGIQTAIPNNAAFSWVNQTSASIVVETGGQLLITSTANAGTNQQGRVINVPGATPYTFKAIFSTSFTVNSFPLIQLGWYDGTKLSTLALQGQSSSVFSVTALNWTNVTTFSAAVPSALTVIASPEVVFGIQNDGTNLNFLWYPDGYTPVTIASQVIGGFLTPTQLGFFINSNQSNAVQRAFIIGFQQM